MKPFFNKLSVTAGQKRPLFGVSCVRVVSVSGAVTISFDSGDALTVSAGDVFSVPIPFLFDRVDVEAAAGASAVVWFGIGNIGAASGGSATGGGVQATTGSPEGVLDAGSGQWAFDSATGFLWVNPATSGSVGWVQIIA